MIYADFDYPEDMDSSISYMPVYDEFFSSSRTIEDNRNYLLSKLDNFIEEQQKKYQLEIKWNKFEKLKKCKKVVDEFC